MSTDDGTPASATELNAELKALLRDAHDNGVDVEGGWECRNGAENPNYPDWDVVVTEVQKNAAD